MARLYAVIMGYPVGSFATGERLIPDLDELLHTYDVPVQTCPVVQRTGARILASGQNYRLAHYGRRFAVAPGLGRIEYQELRETAENWEEWVALYRRQV